MGTVARPARASSASVFGALGVVYVVWGSTYLGIRVAIDDVPALLMVSVRFLAAGGLMYAIASHGATRAERPTRRQVADAAIVGVLLLGVGNGVVTVAELRVPTGVVALLVASVPLWIALLSAVFLRERLPRGAVISLLIGFAGVGILIGPGRAGGASLAAMLLTLVSPLAWSAGSLYGRGLTPPARPMVGIALQMLSAGLVLLVAAAVGGDLGRVHANAFHLRPLLAIAYLIVFGSFIGYTAYAWLLQNAPISLVATYAYVNPLVAVLLGRAFLDEPLAASTLLGGGVIALAVAVLVALPSTRRPRSVARDTAEAPVPAEQGAG